MNILVTNLMMLQEEERFSEILAGMKLFPIFVRPNQFFSEDECLKLVGEIDGWLSGDDEISSNVVQRSLPRLKVIAKWGSGVDSIDLESTKEADIKVFNTPGVFAETVSEVALSYLLALAKKTVEIDREVRLGKWPKPQTLGLHNKDLGIIGFGAIGSAIGRKARSLGMNVNFYDPTINTGLKIADCLSEPLSNVIAQSDFLCLACNLTSKNKDIIDASAISNMRNGAFLINVARGELIKEIDLVEALRAQKLSGAALDVFANEPLDKRHALANFSNVIIGSHNANNERFAVEQTHLSCLKNLAEGLQLNYDLKTLNQIFELGA